jgi:hypothetical protein
MGKMKQLWMDFNEQVISEGEYIDDHDIYVEAKSRMEDYLSDLSNYIKEERYYEDKK